MRSSRTEMRSNDAEHLAELVASPFPVSGFEARIDWLETLRPEHETAQPEMATECSYPLEFLILNSVRSSPSFFWYPESVVCKASAVVLDKSAARRMARDAMRMKDDQKEMRGDNGSS